MALALYRKYRPQTFAEMTDQNHVKITLMNELAAGTVAHAYLFTGPRGVGKTTAARILAKAVNCQKRKEGAGEPCARCEACEAIAAGKALDVIEIDAASNTGVDNVRENIIEHVRFTPSILRVKVFIIDEVHMLSASAFNALLKTLEEPPAHALFILATTELHKVPATIVSRCQRFDFKRIAVPDLAARLAHMAANEERKVAPSVIQAIARAAGGSLRDAESLLGQVLAVTDGAVGDDEASLVLPRSDTALALAFLGAAVRRDAGGALAAVARVAEEGADPLRFTDDCIAVLRKLLLVALERDDSAVSGAFDAETEKAVVRLVAETDVRRTSAMIALLLAKRQQMKTADAGLLPLELAAVELALSGQESGTRDQADARHDSTTRPPVHPTAATPDPQTTRPHDHSTVRPVDAAPPPAKKPRPRGNAAKTTLDAVRGRWQEFVTAVGELSPSLPFVLNVSAPMRVEEGTLVIGSRYPFHRDRLNDQKHNLLLTQAAATVFGEDLGVAAEVSDAAPAEAPGDVAPLSAPADADPSLKTVLDALGGTVVG